MHRSLFLIRTKHLFGVIIAKCWHVKYWIDIELFDSYVGTWLTLSHMWHISWMLEFRPCDLHSLSGLLSSLSFCNLVSPWMKQRYWWNRSPFYKNWISFCHCSSSIRYSSLISMTYCDIFTVIQLVLYIVLCS